jgi:DNA-binding HxlR family transcriptional regulator
MNIALAKADRFNQLLRSTPGMNKRVLAMRLRELAQHGFIGRADWQDGFTRWQLTAKGTDVLPVLTSVRSGTKRDRRLRPLPSRRGPSLRCGIPTRRAERRRLLD